MRHTHSDQAARRRWTPTRYTRLGWALALLGLVAPLAAQDAGDDMQDTIATVEAALFEELLATESIPRLDSLERAADDELRRAMILARRHELSADIRDAQEAFNLFHAIASRDTSAAWAFFGIGRVVSARPAVLFERPGLLDELLPPRRIAGVLGLEPQSRAQQALLRALVLDPTIEAAALMISDMAVVSMDPLELEIAARALTWVAERSDAAPEVWLALSRVRSLMAELFARRTGCCGGKGGSMHMFSKEKGFFGGHGIVGAGTAIGTGLGFAHKYKKDGGVAVAYVFIYILPELVRYEEIVRSSTPVTIRRRSVGKQ